MMVRMDLHDDRGRIIAFKLSPLHLDDVDAFIYQANLMLQEIIKDARHADRKERENAA
jgi:late competence protein required for DNA uptake (superfamily II DNA/RNA helicase)